LKSREISSTLRKGDGCFGRIQRPQTGWDLIA